MLPIVAIGAVALAGLFLHGCGGDNDNSSEDASTPGGDSSMPTPDTYVPPRRNSPPVLTIANNFNAYREWSNEIPFSVSDADGDNITYAVSSHPGNLGVRILENRPGLLRGVLTWAPGCAWSGANPNVRVAMSDNRGGNDEEYVNVAVSNLVASGRGMIDVNQSLTLCTGSYTGVSFNITADNVILNGAGSTLREGEVRIANMVNVENRRGVRISNIRFVNTNDMVGRYITMDGCSDGSVSGVTIQGGHGEGIGIYRSRNMSVARTTINTLGDLAISLDTANTVNISQVDITGSGEEVRTDFRFGLIEMFNSSGVTIISSRISRSGYLGVGAIGLHSVNNSTVQFTELFQNNGAAITIDDRSSNDRIAGCNIHDNRGYGIAFGTASRGHTIEDNTFRNNAAGNVNLRGSNTFRNNMPPL